MKLINGGSVIKKLRRLKNMARKKTITREQILAAAYEVAATDGCAPCMGENLVVKVHYRLGSRNC